MLGSCAKSENHTTNIAQKITEIYEKLMLTGEHMTEKNQCQNVGAETSWGQNVVANTVQSPMKEGKPVTNKGVGLLNILCVKKTNAGLNTCFNEQAGLAEGTFTSSGTYTFSQFFLFQLQNFSELKRQNFNLRSENERDGCR